MSAVMVECSSPVDEILIGENGGRYLRDALSRRNPTAVINEFQRQNALDVPMSVSFSREKKKTPRTEIVLIHRVWLDTFDSSSPCSPVFPLLDLHGIPRSETYRSIMLQLKVHCYEHHSRRKFSACVSR